MSRAFLAGLFVFLSCLLLGFVTLAVVDAVRTGTIAVSTLALLITTLAAILILFGIAAARPQNVFVRPHCTNCGARVYETRRSADRRRLMTCFACGMEWAAPAPANERPPLVADGRTPVTE